MRTPISTAAPTLPVQACRPARGGGTAAQRGGEAPFPPEVDDSTSPPSQPRPSAGGAQRCSEGGGAPSPPEVDDSGAPPVVVGWIRGNSGGGGSGGGGSCHVAVSVQGVPTAGLVDTGSSVTLVRPDVLPSGTPLQPTAVQLRTVTGQLAPMAGKGLLWLCVGGRRVRHLVWVADVQDCCILGLDFLQNTGCVLDMGRGTLSFPGGPTVAMGPLATSPLPPARSVRTLETPLAVPAFPGFFPYPCPDPRAFAQVPRFTAPVSLPPAPATPFMWPGYTPCPVPPSPALGETVMFGDAPYQQLSPLAPVFSPSPGPMVPAIPPCPVWPLQGGEETQITARDPQCQSSALAPPDSPLPLSPVTPAPLPGPVSVRAPGGGELPLGGGVWREEYGDLEEQQQEQLRELLAEFQGSFAASEGEVGRTHMAQHVIDTGHERPIKCHPRRLPLARQQACDQAVDDLLQSDFIEPSESPWAAPVVMVAKKNGDWRFCVDYRRLNDVTIKDSYPLPRIDESLDLVSGSSWFTTLDLKSGYYQVPLSPESRPKSAFCTGRGLWQFKVLSFGLCNAPATFARLMDKVLAGIPRQECLVYLDDILVHGRSFEAALGSLRRVLGKIKEAGLTLHPEKCHFMRREVTFLGHELGAEGIGTMDEKVRAVKEWPTPRDPGQLKSFIGLASYYRRHVRGFATIASPLYRLLEKDRDYVWSEACQEAFLGLKRALCVAPVLAPPDPTLPFTLDTDASGVGVGGVLSQPWPEGERVVAYFSQKLKKCERNYCVTRRELLAVVLSVRHFKYYLCGLPFVIRTDHAALQWLMTFREPEGQVARWLEELQEYDFKVEHRPGARHSNADALSRRPCAAEGCRYCERREARELELRADGGEECAAVSRVEEVVCRELQTVTDGEWRDEQGRDPDLQPVLLWVEARWRPPWEEVAPFSKATKGLWTMFDSLRLSQGVLQRAFKTAATGEEQWQVVVPRGLQEAVLEAMHGAGGSGHFGVNKTLRRLRQTFYWGRQKRDVVDFCRRCDLCVARKGPTGRSQAPLQQFPVGCPMERVGIDITGPYPRSDDGNRFVLSAIDYFTKWPEAYAIPNQEAETIADALVGGMISRLGVMESLHSDRGTNFESRVFAAMCERLGIHKTRTTPLHPQSDGLVERFHRNMGDQLAIVTSRHQKDWDKHLPLVLMACRSAVQESTECTPSLLMLGRELRTPAELAFGRPPDAPAVPAGPEYARKLQDRLDSAHHFAREQLREAGVKQKRYYDVKSRGRDFTADELVWVYNPIRKKGRSPKLDSKWTGPCKVLGRLGEVVYRVQMPPRGRKVALHRDRLAPYRGGPPPLNANERAASPPPPAPPMPTSPTPSHLPYAPASQY